MPVMTEVVDPNPADYTTVPFYNFTSEDLTKEDHAMWNGKPYTVKSGEIKHYPKFLAYHLAKHLIDKIIMKENPERLNDAKLRSELAAKILISEEEAVKILSGQKKAKKVQIKARKRKKQKIDEKEAKTAPKTKAVKGEVIPKVEHSREKAKSVEVRPFSEAKKLE